MGKSKKTIQFSLINLLVSTLALVVYTQHSSHSNAFRAESHHVISLPKIFKWLPISNLNPKSAVDLHKVLHNQYPATALQPLSPTGLFSVMRLQDDCPPHHLLNPEGTTPKALPWIWTAGPQTSTYITPSLQVFALMPASQWNYLSV